MFRISTTMLLSMIMAPAAAPLMAGGMYLTLARPEASPDAAAKGAVILVRADGCQDPAKVEISAVAEGLVNGQRKTVPLKLTRLANGTTHAVAPGWPAEGVWVVRVTGKLGSASVYTLVAMSPDGMDRAGAKSKYGSPSEAEITAMLKSLSRTS
jgi:hypothetical protein